MKRRIEDEVVHYFQEQRAAGVKNTVVDLFSVPDIFAYMLRDRPVAVLRLLSTSKAMYTLLREIGTGLFWLILDTLILSTTRWDPGWPGLTTYAFYVWEYHHGDLRHVLEQAHRDRNRTSTTLDYSVWFKVFASQVGLLNDPAREFEGDQFYSWILDETKNGRDIVTANEDRDAVAMSTILRTMNTDWPNRRIWQVPLDVLRHNDDLLLPDAQRVYDCRKFTCMAPFRLGPFHHLDTRRLHLYRCYVKLTRTLRTQNALSAEGQLFPIPYIARYTPPPKTRISEEELQAREAHIAGVYETMLSTLDEAVRVNPRLYVEPLRDLLQQPLPAPGDLLTLEPYRVALSHLYDAPMVARRALLVELRDIERVHGDKHVVAQYGQCVQCIAGTPMVCPQRMVFLCAECADK